MPNLNVLVMIDHDEADVDVLAISDYIDRLKVTAVENERAVLELGSDEPLEATWVWQSPPERADLGRWVWETEEGMYVISEPHIARV